MEKRLRNSRDIKCLLDTTRELGIFIQIERMIPRDRATVLAELVRDMADVPLEKYSVTLRDKLLENPGVQYLFVYGAGGGYEDKGYGFVCGEETLAQVSAITVIVPEWRRVWKND